MSGLLAFAALGCSKSDDTSGQNAATSTPTPVATSGQMPITSEAPTRPSPAMPEASPSDSPDADATPAPGVLEQKYLSSTDDDDRSDVISQLGDQDNAEALQTLARLFQGEQKMELRVQILSTAADMGDDDDQNVKNQKLILYTNALVNGQPDDVRETAVDGLEQLDDPRTLPLWQRLTQDPDEDIRNSAQAAVERYSQPDN
ncbi:MAG: hypothetical protein QM796_03530 [Chthoniobacteraceae bacterium]